MSLNLNAEPAAPLAPQRKKNLNHEKEDISEMMMNKATKVQLKTDMETDEVPAPLATQEPEAVGTTAAEVESTEHADSTAEDDHEENVAVEEGEEVAEHVETEQDQPEETAEEEEVTHDDTEVAEEEPTAASEVEVTTTVEQRLKQITAEVGKIASEAAQPVAEVGRQSFMSLTDLIRNLRPNDKVPLQIDSLSNMRSAESGPVIVESSRKVRNSQQVY